MRYSQDDTNQSSTKFTGSADEQSSQTIHPYVFEYPTHIKVSGLPFMLQGWNCVFYKSEDVCNGKPVYRLDPYTLYWFIDIIGVSIKYSGGKWQFIRYCDDWPMATNPSLLGTWSKFHNMKVDYAINYE